MHSIEFSGEFITLAQLLKKLDFVSSGGEVREFLLANDVLVNSVKEQRRGKKLYKGDRITVHGQIYELV